MPEQIAEVKAMAEIAELFAGLEEDEVRRVLRWAYEKYMSKADPGAVAILPRQIITPPGTPLAAARPQNFTDLPTLIDAAQPTTGLDRILVVGYYYQVVSQEADFDSQTVNRDLKNLGHPSANITRDIDRLVNRSPKLIIQTRKEGTTQQARKRFRLTVEGIRTVEALLKHTGQ